MAAIVCVLGGLAIVWQQPSETDVVATNDMTGVTQPAQPSSDATEEELGTSYTITIPAGSTVDEIVEQLATEVLHLDADELVAVLGRRDIRSPFLSDDEAPLATLNGFRSAYEGLLAPGVIEITSQMTEEVVLQSMADAMEERVAGVLAAENGEIPMVSQPSRHELSPHELLVVASIIEREAATTTDGPRIARVIYNRLAQDMHLGIDSTTCYAVRSERCSTLTADDLESDSPWNTRTHLGLPPTPIGTPSLASLRAAMAPSEGDWIYYLGPSDTGSLEGSTFYSTTEEFIDALARRESPSD